MPNIEWFGSYALLERLGRGGTGEVFLARPNEALVTLPPLVVVKRLLPELARHPSSLKRFRHEAKLAMTVQSPFVARVHEAEVLGESPYMVVDYVEGWTIERVHEDLAATGEVSPVPGVVEIALDILSGLDALRQARDVDGAPLGIVHRDLNPRNVVLGQDGIARIIDLGLGKSARQDWRTATGMVLGSPGYMAPEQVFGEEADHRTDLYACGVMLWELLTLQPYIPKTSGINRVLACARPTFRAPSDVREGVPPALDALLRALLDVEPRNRPSTASEVRGALVELMPPSGNRDAVRALVSDLLWRELDATRVELTRYLGMTLPDAHPPTLRDDATVEMEPELTPTFPLDEMPTVTPVRERTAPNVAVVTAPKRRRVLRAVVQLGSIAAAVVIGMAIERRLSSERAAPDANAARSVLGGAPAVGDRVAPSATPLPPTTQRAQAGAPAAGELAGPSATALPRASATALPIAAGEPSSTEPEPSGPNVGSREPVGPSATALPRTPEQTSPRGARARAAGAADLGSKTSGRMAGDVPAPSAPAMDNEALRQETLHLLERIRRVRQRPEQRAEASELLADANSLYGYSNRPDRWRAALDRLWPQVEALESKASTPE